MKVDWIVNANGDLNRAHAVAGWSGVTVIRTRCGLDVAKWFVWRRNQGRCKTCQRLTRKAVAK